MTWAADLCASWSGVAHAAEKEEFLPVGSPRVRSFPLLRATPTRLIISIHVQPALNRTVFD